MTAHLDYLEPEMQHWVMQGVLSLQEAWTLDCLSLMVEPGELAPVPENLRSACSRLWLAEMPVYPQLQ